MDGGGSVIPLAPRAAVSVNKKNDLVSMCCETGSLLYIFTLAHITTDHRENEEEMDSTF